MNEKIRLLRERLRSLNLEGMIITNPINIKYLTNIENEGTLLIIQEELEAEVKKVIEDQKNNELEDKYLDECLEKAAENMTIELNEEIIDDEIHRMIHQFESQLKMQGLSLEQYAKFTGIDHEAMHKQMEPEAIKRVKYRYLLEEIAEVEKIDFKEEEVEKKATEMAENYGITKEELIEAYGSLDVVKYDMKMREAMEIIRASK